MGSVTALKRDLKYIWHPYTQMKDAAKYPPVVVKKAKGLKLYDSEGRSYYDTISSWWCSTHGHNHPYINAAIRKQLKAFEHVMFAGFTHEPGVELAERLVKLAGHDMARVFYSDNGSTAVEVAMKMSLQYWQNIGVKGKTRFLCLDRGYHGDTIGTMSVGGKSSFNDKFKGVMFESFRVPSPYCYRCPFEKNKSDCALECLKAAEEMIAKNKDSLSAIIIEPLVLGAGGMIVYPKEYLAGISRLAQKYNVHLILDEIAVGFGRTGRMFAFEHVKNIKFDFLCLSKGLTAGYMPMAVTMTTKKVYDSFYADYNEGKTFFHGHTFTANPLACAAALASLDLFDRRGGSRTALENAQNIGKKLQQHLSEYKDHPYVGDIRGIGTIGAIELVKNKVTKKEFDPKLRIGYQIYKEGLKHGLVLRPLGNVIYFFLPLSTSEKELKDIFRRFKKVMQWRI